MSILNLLQQHQSEQGDFQKVAQSNEQEIRDKAEQSYLQGAELAWEHLKKAAEKMEEEEKGEDGKKEEKDPEKRVEDRTKEIYEQMKKKKEEKETSE